MSLEGNPFVVPHFKALISCQKFWGRQRCGSTLRLWNTLFKISILLHNMASDWFILSTAVYKETSIKLGMTICNKKLQSGIIIVYFEWGKKIAIRYNWSLFWTSHVNCLNLMISQEFMVHSILISNISSGSFENSFKEQPFPSSTIVSYKS